MEPTIEQLEAPKTEHYPNVNSQQDSMDVSLRIQSIELAIRAGALNESTLPMAENIHTFITKR